MTSHSTVRRFRLRAVAAVGALTLAALASVAVAPAHADHEALAPGTPCSRDAWACVDVDGRQAWLIDEHGEVVRGPVPISVGAPGHETPRGDFRVEWKHADHRSGEFDGAPMPWAVFFAPGGIAFHEGDLGSDSAGCVRLGPADAAAFYDFLDVGDLVEVR